MCKCPKKVYYVVLFEVLAEVLDKGLKDYFPLRLEYVESLNPFIHFLISDIWFI